MMFKYIGIYQTKPKNGVLFIGIPQDTECELERILGLIWQTQEAPRNLRNTFQKVYKMTIRLYQVYKLSNPV